MNTVTQSNAHDRHARRRTLHFRDDLYPFDRPTLEREVHDDTALLIDVCSIDSIWGKERELAEFFADRLTAWGCEQVELVESRPGRPSVGARLRGSGGGRSLVLNGHLDIYELSEDWTRDPFAAALENGKVYGAGIADMKAGTAAAAAALRRIAGEWRPATR